MYFRQTDTNPTACVSGSARFGLATSPLSTTLFRALLLLALGFLLSAGLAQNNPVSVRLEIYVVSLVGGQETFTEATSARPGQTVEYRLFATNNDSTTLPAGTVVVTGPVPDGTTFVANSATVDEAQVLTEYSIDAASYGEEPIIIGTRTAEAVEYQAVRWTLLFDMEPGQEAMLVYRVTVNQN